MFIDLSFGHFTGLEIITCDLNSVLEDRNQIQNSVFIKQQGFQELHNRNVREREPLSSAWELKNGLWLQQLAKY